MEKEEGDEQRQRQAGGAATMAIVLEEQQGEESLATRVALEDVNDTRGVSQFAHEKDKESVAAMSVASMWPYNAFGTEAAGDLDPRVYHENSHPAAKKIAREKGLAIFAFDYNGTGSKGYVVMAYYIFYMAKVFGMALVHAMLRLMRPIEWHGGGGGGDGPVHCYMDHMYEALLVERPVKPYVDLEFDVPLNRELVHMVDEMTRGVMRMIAAYLAACFPNDPRVQDIAEEDWIVLDSSNGDKVSRHLVLDKEGVYFDTLADHARFMAIVLKHFKTKVPNERDADPSYRALCVVRRIKVHKNVVGADGTTSRLSVYVLQLIPYADPCPYKEFQLWRTPWSTKFGSPRILVPALMNRSRVSPYAPAGPGGRRVISWEFMLAALVTAVRRPCEWVQYDDAAEPVLEVTSRGLMMDGRCDAYLYGYSHYQPAAAYGAMASTNVVLYPIGEEEAEEEEEEGEATAGGKRKAAGGARGGGGAAKRRALDAFCAEGEEEFEEGEERPVPIIDGFAEATKGIAAWEKWRQDEGGGAMSVPSDSAPRPFSISNAALSEAIRRGLIDFVRDSMTEGVPDWYNHTRNFVLKPYAKEGMSEPYFYMLNSDAGVCPIKTSEHDGGKPKTYGVFHKSGHALIKCHAGGCEGDPKRFDEKVSPALLELMWPSIRLQREKREEESRQRWAASGGAPHRAPDVISFDDVRRAYAAPPPPPQQQQPRPDPRKEGIRQQISIVERAMASAHGAERARLSSTMDELMIDLVVDEEGEEEDKTS
jgi:hypothetical protein